MELIHVSAGAEFVELELHAPPILCDHNPGDLLRAAMLVFAAVGRRGLARVGLQAIARHIRRQPGINRLRERDRKARLARGDFGDAWRQRLFILRRLDAYGCDVQVFPADAPAGDLLASNPDGIFLSNGPGDPAALTYAIDNVRQLVNSDRPMFGICLGHQILGLAVGGQTFKLKFGHRGANHPVKELSSGKVEITSQNHGFAVDPGSLPADVRVTHLNLYDGTVEGFRHTTKPIFSVQYHPEASPGPHDADYLFREFLDVMEKG